MKAKAVAIISLVTNEHEDYDNNAVGTQIAIEELFEEHGTRLKSFSFNLSNVDRIKSTIDRLPYTIVVAAGEHSIKTLCDLKKDSKLGRKIYTSWSGHQLFDGLPEVVNIIDSVALPKHVLDDKSKAFFKSRNAATLVETVGVAHNTHPKDLTYEFEKWGKHIIPAIRYNMVVLGGDAPDEKKVMHYYTPDEAFNLGKYIGQRTKGEGSFLLVINSPRTGKHDPKTANDSLSHREAHPETNKPLDYKIDAVSQAFLKGVEEKGLLNGINYQFFDFKFGKDGVVNAYKGLFGAVAKTPGSHVFISGESTSTVSEACDLLPLGSVTVYDTNAMNAAHKAHIDSIHQEGYAHRLTSDLTLIPIITTASSILPIGCPASSSEAAIDNSEKKSVSAALAVADSIYTILEKSSWRSHVRHPISSRNEASRI